MRGRARCASRTRQRAAAFVETVLAVPIVLLMGLSTVQYGQLLHARANLNYAIHEAARAGSTEHASPDSIRLSFARALTPLYGGGKKSSEIAASYARALAAVGTAQVQILNPTKESFDDFGKFDAALKTRVIRNDNLMVVSNAVKSKSGQNIQDATLLKLRVTFAFKPEVPIIGHLLSLYSQKFGLTGDDAVADGMRALGQIPVVAQATIRMQSDAWENSLLISNPGKGNDGKVPPPDPLIPVDPKPSDPACDASDPDCTPVPICTGGGLDCSSMDPPGLPDPECPPNAGFCCAPASTQSALSKTNTLPHSSVPQGPSMIPKV